MPYKPSPSEPIAVVASSCRFAGGATSPSKLWELLKEPPDLTRPVPASRFNIRAFYHPEGDYHGTTNARNSYWLDKGDDDDDDDDKDDDKDDNDNDQDDVRAFDAGFFGIAPKEAEAVDPQQRLLLETVYEALESSGYRLRAWTGHEVGVFVGAMTSDFDSMSQRDDLTTSPYYATGNARSILANRISYFFDFHGPSATIDTACSSSLVALHQAVLSLRAGDCGAACVAGVNLMLAPEQFVVESSLHMLSPTGRCHMWDTRADGYARGEGAAVLLLKPLSRALADGDAARIQGIVRATGVGSDGRTSGITMPSPTAQANLIRATYRRAGLDVADAADRCQYFEAHGTGTPVGDPREAAAIHDTFFGGSEKQATSDSENTDKKESLLVGSVKTVIGHTEGAAGLAGVLKVMLAMKHAQVPPNLHLQELSPSVAPFCTPSSSPSSRGHLEVVTRLQSWPAIPAGQPMRASVNSFGFGGTNAHAIIEHYDTAIHTPGVVAENAPVASKPNVSLPHIPLVLSATSSASLRALAKRYLKYLQRLHDNDAPLSLQDVAWLVAKSRTSFMQRLSISASDRTGAISALSSIMSSSGTGDFGVRARRTDDAPLRLLGIFTGQGAQWAGMSRHLFAASRIYRECIASLDAVLQSCPHPPAWRLAAELQKSDVQGSRVREAAISQPLSTAVQIGLVAILNSLGLQFACVVGHSSGEIGAAHAAGRLSARDAILVAYYRGLSMAHPAMACRQGGMLAVGMASEAAAVFCRQLFQSALCVAASNSPTSTTLSGDVAAVERAQRMLERDGIFARRLVVDRAYHSHHMAGFADVYADYLEGCHVTPLDGDDDDDDINTTKPVWISSVDPERAAPTRTQLAGQYWVDNMVKPVRFREAVEAALALPVFRDGVDGVVEVGPHATLKGPVLDTVAGAAQSPPSTSPGLPYKSLLRRGQRDDVMLQDFIGFWTTHFDPSPLKLDGLLNQDEQEMLRSRLAAMHRGHLTQLPAYAWDHAQLYYRQSRIARQFHHQTAAPHELLGTRTRDDVDGCELRWRNLLRVDKLPWLAQHAFQGQPLVPASAYCLMALDAAKCLLGGRAASRIELEDVEYVGGTLLEDADGAATEIMFSLTVQSPAKMAATATTAAPSRREGEKTINALFSVYSAPEASTSPMSRRCSGRIRIVLGTPDADTLPRRTDPAQQPETVPVPVDAFYGMMTRVGLAYSGPFQAIASLRRRHNVASASLPRFHGDDTTGLAMSPATLDACLQTCFATFSSPGDKALWTAFLPIHTKKVVFNMAAHASVAGAAGPKRCPGKSPKNSDQLHVDAELTTFAEATRDHPSRITGDICVYNNAGEMEVQVEGLTVGSFASADPAADRELYLHTTYATDPEYALVGPDDSPNNADVDDRILQESCERVAAFGDPASAWPAETEATLQQHILASPYALTLSRVRRELALPGPPPPCRRVDDNAPACQALLAEGRQASHFQHQVSRIVAQISHRYPRLSVLSLTDAGMGLSRFVLGGLGEAFTGYTSALVGGGNDDNEGDPGFAAYVHGLPEHIAQKVHTVSLAHARDIKAALASSSSSSSSSSTSTTPVIAAAQPPFDLVVMSTSVFKQQLEPSATVLARIKQRMRPGAFLLLVHMPLARGRTMSTTMTATTKTSSTTRSNDAMITPPDWPDLLEQTGFMDPAIRNSDQHYPGGFSITVRQCDSLFKKQLACGQGGEGVKLDDRLLIVAGTTADTVSLAAATAHFVSPHLRARADAITVVYGLDDLAAMPPASLSSFRAAIVLADLDHHRPLLSTLDDRRLGALRTLLLLPDLTLLWVTRGARTGNAENAASYGFTRSVRAEMPRLTLQMLDFDGLAMVDGQLRVGGGSSSSKNEPLAASLVAKHFVQLLHGSRHKDVFTNNPRHDEPSHLWVLETELFIGTHGERLIPRLVPFRPANDNYNASRRVVTTPVNTLSTCLSVERRAATACEYTTRLGPSVASLIASAHRDNTDTTTSLIRVLYSTPDALVNNLYLCIGRDELHGTLVAAMARSSASFVTVPRQHTVALSLGLGGHAIALADYAGILANMLLCQAIICRTVVDTRTPIVLIGPDSLLAQCAVIVAAASGHRVVSVQLSAKAPDSNNDDSSSTVFIHPRATQAQMRAALRRIGASVFFVDFLPPGNAIATHLRTHLAAGCTYQAWDDVGRHFSTAVDENEACRMLQQTVASTEASRHKLLPRTSPNLVSVAALLDSPRHHSTPGTSPRIVDWRADRIAPHVEQPLGTVDNVANSPSSSPSPSPIHLRHDRTYVLVGITRDMGHSLATLLVRHGARHVVLASRTHQPSLPQWAARLQEASHPGGGAVVRFASLDVTDLAAVRAFRDGLVASGLPPVAGVVNGAMVLDDHVLAHMTAATLARVLRPKTVGSRNLDAAFSGDDLDFFIMTSSFAAPGGHAGQANYAAANMYMNGLAADRRRRGLAASVLNIGVIYGLGFLHREKEELYAGLEREGYPPISERDLHHMVLEAIRRGHPQTSESLVDLTTGLCRFDPDQPPDNALHWHADPRFSHFVVRSSPSSSTPTHTQNGKGAAADNSATKQLTDTIREATAPLEVVSHRLAAALIDRLSSLLHLDTGTTAVCGDNSLAELGVDSLVAVETRTWLWRTTGQDVPVMRILGAPSINKYISTAIVAGFGS